MQIIKCMTNKSSVFAHILNLRLVNPPVCPGKCKQSIDINSSCDNDKVCHRAAQTSLRPPRHTFGDLKDRVSEKEMQ